MSLIELNQDDDEEEEHHHQHHPYRMDLTAALPRLIDFAHQQKIVAVVAAAAAVVVGTGVVAAVVVGIAVQYLRYCCCHCQYSSRSSYHRDRKGLAGDSLLNVRP